MPGEIKNITPTPDKYNLSMSWTTPCHPNGIIIGYDIDRTNQDDANDHFSYNTSTNATSYSILENILPYRNYSVGVRARTAEGPGNYTYRKDVQTRTAGKCNDHSNIVEYHLRLIQCIYIIMNTRIAIRCLCIFSQVHFLVEYKTVCPISTIRES